VGAAVSRTPLFFAARSVAGKSRYLRWLRAPGSHRAVAAYETAWVPNRPARINAAKALNSLACRRDVRIPCGTIGGALDA
jgi:hypothetical protein